MKLIEALARAAARDVPAGIDAAVRHHAKRALLDWLAALYPGTRMAPGIQLVCAHADELGHGRSSLPGYGTTAFPATAAWINGSVSQAAEFDDLYRDAVFHPGGPIIAAALALAEDRGRSGSDLLDAIVVGYEVATRLGAAIQPAHYRRFHTTGTMGGIGAAAAAATLAARGDVDTMRHALANAAALAAGMQQALRSDAMTKALHAGHAAAVGVRAALTAAHGVTGVMEMLDGPVGLGAVMADAPRWEVALAGLGSAYNIGRITQKSHACCGHAFPAIDAALALRTRGGGLDADDVAAIEVATYRVALDVAGRRETATPYDAKFSLPYVIAHALRYGSVRLDAFSAQRLADPALRRLMQACTLAEDPDMTAGFPGRRAARVVLTLRDGRRLEHLAPYRKGDPEDPLSDADLGGKFDELAGPVLGRARAAHLRERVWGLERWALADLSLASDRP